MCPPASGTTLTPTTTGFDPNEIPECVPTDQLSKAAYKHAAKHLHPWILNHSPRVYLLAKSLATREESSWIHPRNLPLLFTACICHDLGTTTQHNGPQRFEVEGADAAVTLCKDHGVGEAEAHEVWVAIALHTSPGIAERISPLARLVRLAVAMDFKRPAAMRLVSGEEVKEYEELFERGEIEKVLGDAVAEQALGVEGEEERGLKAPAASWTGVLLRSKEENPGWEGVNKAF